jgi:hypothetical protein
MSLSPNEIHQLARTFPKVHAAQIKVKAAKYAEPPDDISQEVSVIILEKGSEFDPAIGSFCQFIFGHLEKRMLRQLGAHTFAVSLDRDDILGGDTRILVENLAAPADHDDTPVAINIDTPGVAKILSTANYASGKSTSDLARLLGVTPRRVRQILQKLREQYATSNQFELCLEEDC